MTGLMVVIMTSLLAAFFFGVDSAFSAIVHFLLGLLELATETRARKTPRPMSRWYIIHAYSGFENKVRDAIMAEATRLGLTPLVESVEVPTEKVTEVRRGKKVTSDRKFFPGYVLAKLAMNDDVYHLVKNTPKVTGFLGSRASRSRSRTPRPPASSTPRTKPPPPRPRPGSASTMRSATT